MLNRKFVGMFLASVILFGLWVSSWPLVFAAVYRPTRTNMEPEVFLQGDINKDEIVNILDVVLVLGHYETHRGDPNYTSPLTLTVMER